MSDAVEQIKKRISDAKDTLDVALNPDDPNLIDQLTLGEDWDDPTVLGRALDMHPLWMARWSTLLKTLRKKEEQLKMKYDTWESIVKDEIFDELYQSNINSGMTPNNSKPTATQVNSKFATWYVKGEGEEYEDIHKDYLDTKKPLDSIRLKIDKVDVIVKAFDIRTQMLIQISGIARTLMDNKLSHSRKGKG